MAGADATTALDLGLLATRAGRDAAELAGETASGAVPTAEVVVNEAVLAVLEVAETVMAAGAGATGSSVDATDGLGVTGRLPSTGNEATPEATETPLAAGDAGSAMAMLSF
jgi:hypothetical protein